MVSILSMDTAWTLAMKIAWTLATDTTPGSKRKEDLAIEEV